MRLPPFDGSAYDGWMESLLAEYFSFNSALFRTASGLHGDIQWLVAVWFLMVGGCIGSLMNVVIYRWPAGMSIVYPGSRCPHCLHSIRLYDNVPVISWLVLRARCRDCKAPIPIRYPTVEASVAVIFFALFVVEVIQGGSNLPASELLEDARAAARTPAARPPGLLWGIFALHTLLSCTLICAALIEFDGRRLPAKLIWPPLLIVGLVTLFWPQLRPLADVSGVDPSRHWWVGLYDSLAGIALAGLCGTIFDWRLPTNVAGHRHAVSATWVAVVIGAMLGYAAALQICVLAALLTLAAEGEILLRPRVRILPVSSYLTISTLLFLLYWRLIYDHTYWQAPRMAGVFASLVMISVAAGLAGWMRGNKEPK